MEVKEVGNPSVSSWEPAFPRRPRAATPTRRARWGLARDPFTSWCCQPRVPASFSPPVPCSEHQTAHCQGSEP